MLPTLFLTLRIMTASSVPNHTLGMTTVSMHGGRCLMHVRAVRGVKRPYNVAIECDDLPECARVVGGWSACGSYEEVK